MEFVESFDGAKLAVHSVGDGRPVILLHGLFSSADMNWISFGHAQTIADAGFRVIMPDLRAHGQSDAPHDPAAYPPDALVRDARAVADALELEPGGYDLVGFSLGARTATNAVLAGMQPGKLALCGMGLQGLNDWGGRTTFFVDAIDRFDEVKQGDPAFLAVAFMRKMEVDRAAARLLLESLALNSTGDLAGITVPTAVICGDQDRDNGSPQDLANALPNGRHVEIPGTHMSCVTKRELGEAIRDFLTA